MSAQEALAGLAADIGHGTDVFSSKVPLPSASCMTLIHPQRLPEGIVLAVKQTLNEHENDENQREARSSDGKRRFGWSERQMKAVKAPNHLPGTLIARSQKVFE